MAETKTILIVDDDTELSDGLRAVATSSRQAGIGEALGLKARRPAGVARAGSAALC